MSFELAARLAPAFYLDADEPYWPVSLEDYVRNCELRSPGGGGDGGRRAEPADLLAAGSKSSLRLASGAAARRGGAPDNRAAYPAGPAVYARARKAADGGWLLSYHLFFAYNGTVDSHVGDHEYVVIRADRWGAPAEAWFSNHDGGFWKSWWSPDVRREPGTGRLRVFVARESHALNPVPGRRPRLFGLGSDECSPAAAPLDAPVLPVPPEFEAYEGEWAEGMGEPFFPASKTAECRKCTTDVLAAIRRRVPDWAVVLAFAGSLTGAVWLALAAWYFDRWWLLLPALPLAVVWTLAWQLAGTDPMPWSWWE